jgi:hypothetical protein
MREVPPRPLRLCVTLSPFRREPAVVNQPIRGLPRLLHLVRRGADNGVSPITGINLCVHRHRFNPLTRQGIPPCDRGRES